MCHSTRFHPRRAVLEAFTFQINLVEIALAIFHRPRIRDFPGN